MSTENRPPSVYVDDVFEEVLALPTKQREAAIDARCVGMPSLAAEVRDLLAFEADAPPPKVDRIRKGEQFGRYQLEECLGEGASASVWRAWDTHLRAWTALKLLHPELGARANALESVLGEARAASAIISDYVVRIKAAGKIPDGPHYVEMQLCAEQAPGQDGVESLVIGQTLSETKPRDTREAVRMVMEAALGCDAAHRVGVLHRDIKPANILITPLSRRALVADFGLSSPRLHPQARQNTPSTATITLHLHELEGALVGTPSYMPPEQAWGDPATRANDVYSLGATLWSLLVGRAPYHPPDQERALPALQVVHLVRMGPPEPLYKAAPGTPAALCRMVNKAMAREAKDRYPTAAAFAADLQLYLTDFPTSMDYGRPDLRLFLAMRRNRAVLGTGLVMSGMVLVFALAIVGLEFRRSALSHQVTQAEQQLVIAQDQALTALQNANVAAGQRDRALGERDTSESARKAALRDRDRAEKGLTMAEQRAALEADARALAEQDRAAAIAARAHAEQQLAKTSDAEGDLRQQLQNEKQALQRSIERLQAEQRLREGLEIVLAETDLALEDAGGDIERLAQEVFRLRDELKATEAAFAEVLLGQEVGTAPVNAPAGVANEQRRAVGAPPSF